MLQVLSFDVAGKIMLALVSGLLIRYMPPTAYVEYSVSYALVILFVQLCSGSLNRVYLVGHERFNLAANRRVFVHLQVLLIALAVPVLIAVVGVRTPLAWTCAAALVVGCMAELLKSSFQHQLRFQRFSLVELSRAVLTVAGVALLVFGWGHNLRAVQVQLVNVIAVAAIVAVNGLPGLSWPRAGAATALLHFATRLLQGPYRYLFAYFAVLAVFGQADLLVLKFLCKEQQVATYASAYRYYNVLLLALTAVNSVLLPSAQRIKSMDDAGELRSQHRGAMFLFIPGVLLSMAAASYVMPLIDQGKYPGAPFVFQILAISSIVSFSFSPYINFVMRFEDFQFLFKIVCGALILGVGLNVLLAPRWGAAGAALSVLASTGLLNVSGSLRCARYRGLPAVAA
jgi:O-antigen/teichoic acid export membrane protein